MANPAEALRRHIQLKQRREVPQHPVQIAHQTLHPSVRRLIQVLPVQRALLAPLVPLRKLAAHVQQFLARMAPHVTVVSPQVGKALPFAGQAVTGHLAQHRAFAVNHFIVRDRQHEVVVEGVHQREPHLVLMPTAVNGRARHVAQRVVHPAHVPLVVETQAAALAVVRGRARGAWERGRFLRDHDRFGPLDANRPIQAPQEFDGLQVLAPTQAVGQPLAVTPAVIAVEHGGHRVHAQAVHAEALDPIQRIADEEVAHLGAAIVVDEGVPVRVIALAGVGVFVEVRAVELRQAVFVAGEVRRYPIQNHAQPGGMGGVHKRFEFLGRTVAHRGRIQAGRLVAPGTIERKLLHRQQLQVREPQILRVGNELLGQLRPRQPGAIGPTPPRADMNFVDADRRIQCIGALAFGGTGHARRQTTHHRGRGRAQLALVGVGVGLEAQHAIPAQHLEFVACALAQLWDEQLPHPATCVQMHDVSVALPAVEIPHHRHPLGRRCPHRKAHTAHRLCPLANHQRVRTQHLVRAQMGALAQQPNITLTQVRHKRLGRLGAWRSTPIGSFGESHSTHSRRFKQAGIKRHR